MKNNNMKLIMENWRKFSDQISSYSDNISIITENFNGSLSLLKEDLNNKKISQKNYNKIIYESILKNASDIQFYCSKLEKLYSNKSLVENEKYILEEQNLLNEAFENLKSMFSKVFSSKETSQNPKAVSQLSKSLETVKTATKDPRKKSLLNSLKLIAIAAAFFSTNIAKADISPADLSDIRDQIKIILTSPEASESDKTDAKIMLQNINDPEKTPEIKNLFEKMKKKLNEKAAELRGDNQVPFFMQAANEADALVKSAAGGATTVSQDAFKTASEVTNAIFKDKSTLEKAIKQYELKPENMQTAQGVVFSLISKLFLDGKITDKQRDDYRSGSKAQAWTAAVTQHLGIK